MMIQLLIRNQLLLLSAASQIDDARISCRGGCGGMLRLLAPFQAPIDGSAAARLELFFIITVTTR